MMTLLAASRSRDAVLVLQGEEGVWRPCVTRAADGPDGGKVRIGMDGNLADLQANVKRSAKLNIAATQSMSM
jgi:hypothetical protein